MSYIIRPATPADAKRIAPILREQDHIEVMAASGRTPEAAILPALSVPGAETIFAETVNGDPILIGGVLPWHSNVGCIWMLATPLLERFAVATVKEARRKIAGWHTTYPVLGNMTWAENDLHLRFLRFMGFRLLRRVEVRGTTFIEFAKHHV